MKICLIRHGETDWNSIGKFQGREDIPLNKTGIEQIQRAADYLKKSKWDEIITSPLSRAEMSAEIIRKEIGLQEIHEETDFMERDLGKISGMTKEEAERNFPDGNYEGMEPLEKLQDRTIKALMKWIKQFNEKNIIIMTHGATINSILTNLSGNKIEMGKAIPKNACITLLEKQGDTINIVFYNKEENEL
jgi:uncharacterized phosphatase